MKIKKIILNADDMPKTVVAHLTVREAAWIAERAGRTTADEIAEGLYEGMAGSLFNRYWDCGVDGAVIDLDMPRSSV